MIEIHQSKRDGLYYVESRDDSGEWWVLDMTGYETQEEATAAAVDAVLAGAA